MDRCSFIRPPVHGDHVDRVAVVTCLIVVDGECEEGVVVDRVPSPDGVESTVRIVGSTQSDLTDGGMIRDIGESGEVVRVGEGVVGVIDWRVSEVVVVIVGAEGIELLMCVTDVGEGVELIVGVCC